MLNHKQTRIMAWLFLLILCLSCIGMHACAETAELPVQVSVRIPVMDKAFETRVVLEPADAVTAEYFEPASRTIGIPAGAAEGNSRFDLSFDKKGTWHFRLYQQKDSISGILYDEAPYLVTVSVMSTEGVLQPVLTAKKAGSDAKAEGLLFENRPESVPPTENPPTPPAATDVPHEGNEPTPVPPSVTPTPVPPAQHTDRVPTGGGNSNTTGGRDVTSNRTPKTGDTTNIELWIIMLAASVVGAVLLILFLVFGKRRKDKKEN